MTSGNEFSLVPGPDCLPRDEDYEKGLIKSNMVYKVHWTEPPRLMALEDMCGHLPQFNILDTKEVQCHGHRPYANMAVAN